MTIGDECVYLREKEVENFINKIYQIINAASLGIYVPFDLACIEKIVVHPKIIFKSEIYANILAAIEGSSLNCKPELSQLIHPW